MPPRGLAAGWAEQDHGRTGAPPTAVVVDMRRWIGRPIPSQERSSLPKPLVILPSPDRMLCAVRRETLPPKEP